MLCFLIILVSASFKIENQGLRDASLFLTYSHFGDHAEEGGFFKLPYRIVFAIATLNSVYIYDTECVAPVAVLAGLHYAAITDITW